METRNGAGPWWGDTADAQGMKDALDLVARGEYARPLGAPGQSPAFDGGYERKSALIAITEGVFIFAAIAIVLTLIYLVFLSVTQYWRPFWL